MIDGQHVFVWGGTWHALASELSAMPGKVWGANDKLWITDVLPRVECSNLNEGVGVIAEVRLADRTPGQTYGKVWREPTYKGEPQSRVVRVVMDESPHHLEDGLPHTEVMVRL